jgi:NAD(P)-dependent dehydrogenase (short-subunit alcohol dehydrogenase family)
MSKVWLITGCSRGLGRELAKAVLDAGHGLVATARNPEVLQALVEPHANRARAVALDVTDPGAAKDAVAVASAVFGRLDVVVNNAGYANLGTVEDMTEDDFRAQIETDFFGVVNVTRAALPVLRLQRSGHVIQIASIGGRRGDAGLSAYQAAKWAVEGFSEALSKEVAPLGIRVTIVEPGGMRTDWAGASMHVGAIASDYLETAGRMAEFLQTNPDVMRGEPARAAQAILRIAEEPEPPLRLLLGSDAVQIAESLARERAAEDAKWRTLSLSTDRDGVPDLAKTPAGELRAASLL